MSDKATWVKLYSYYDGSVLYKIPMKELAAIPTWSGNRYMNMTHIETIREAIANITHLDGPYTIVEHIDEDGVKQLVLIDGQHRRYVRCFNEDGTARVDDTTVLIQYYTNKTESDTVDLFKQKNTCLPLKYCESAIHKYHILLKHMRECTKSGDGGWFGKDCIRMAKTTRPRINAEDLQKKLIAANIFKDGADGPSVQHIVNELKRINSIQLKEFHKILYEETGITQKYALNYYKATLHMIKTALDMGFALGIDSSYQWIQEIKIPHCTTVAIADLLQLGE